LDAHARRELILQCLSQSAEPVTGHDLSLQLGVSRQVIVQDVALLRAQGVDIVATPRGYVMAQKAVPGRAQAVVACTHDECSVERELMLVVQHGGEVLDVTVEHPLYGQITGVLMLKTPDDVKQFVSELKRSGAGLLSSLTRGVHLHTIRARDSRTLTTILSSLAAEGFLPED